VLRGDGLLLAAFLKLLSQVRIAGQHPQYLPQRTGSAMQPANWTANRSREIISAERFFEAGEEAKAV